MKSHLRVASPPSKPTMIFDGDCNFCTLWIRRWQQATGDRVEYIAFQDPHVASQFPELPREQFETAVHLIEPDGAVYSGAEAVFRSLATHPARRLLLRWYENVAVFSGATEWAYRFVARHRTFFSALTRFGWGRHVEQPSHFLVRWLFLGGLGLIYLIAFVSLWIQIQGLVGSNGILPARQTMEMMDRNAATMKLGLDRYWMMPTLCWLSASDGFLNGLCAAGVVFSVLLVAGVAPKPCLLLLWLIYLSLIQVCRDFLGFQWDNLLLEAGFLAIFLVPWRLWPFRDAGRDTPPSKIVLWLLRWLLFRLMFESGCVKLLSGDPLWHNLTALTVHYETQPLPTWIGWWAHQLPLGFQRASCSLMFVIELAVPFLFFAPRRLRLFGGAATLFLQVLILLTGNYTFFNILTILLCVSLLDDCAARKLMPDFLRRAFGPDTRPTYLFPRPRWRCIATFPLAAVLVTVSMLELFAMLGGNTALFFPLTYGYFAAAPFRSINNYGLFAVMTNPRREIIIEGSNDGVMWLPYEFKYKPGDVKSRPRFVAPHQPRLDWQMWFAALGNAQGNPWFINFCVRLLQGSPQVLAMLEKNPFTGKPPLYVRATLYEYHFTDVAGRKRDGAWWKRERVCEYVPPLSLRQ